MAKRLQAMGQPNYINGFELALHEKALELPLMWKKPQTIFVNSMSDLFHEDVPVKFIQKAFHVMGQAHWHRFQILTKRSDRLLELNPKLSWNFNIWMGVSVETQEYTFRIDQLRKVGAKVKFISFEPLLGPINGINLKGIDWIIVGGESGPQARPMDASWAVNIRDQCQRMQVPFFFKQWGGPNRKKTGRKLEGRTWDEIPSAANSMTRAVGNY
jgi:protein gp37